MTKSLKRTNQSGYSLMEVTVVLLLAVVVLLVVFGMIEEATKASLFVESHNELAQLAQLPVNRIQEEILQSRTIFVSGTIGDAYVTNMLVGVNAAWQPIANWKLPVQVASTTSFAGDPGTGSQRETGNVLLIARQLPPLMIPYDHDSNAGTAPIPFPADRYRFELYYLRRDTTKGFRAVMSDGTYQRFGYIHDLVEVQSIVYADYFQLNSVFNGTGALTATQKATIVTGLSNAGINKAWNAGQNAVAASFYNVVSGGTLTSIATPSIGIASTGSMLNLKQPGISGKLDYTIAMNTPNATPTFRVVQPVPRYAIRDASLPGFPGGLEFKIVGAGNTLKVLMRVLVFSNYGGSKMDAGEGVVIAQAG